MKLTHNWKTQSGLEVTATCELILKETSFADGWNVEVDVCKQNFNITLGDKAVGHYINRKLQTISGTTIAATCGKLGISQDNLDAIDNMVAKIESHPSWIAKEEKEAKNRKESAEYEAHSAKMAKVMGN